MCSEVGLLKINVERAEWDVLAGIADKDWPKVSGHVCLVQLLVCKLHIVVTPPPPSRFQQGVTALKRQAPSCTQLALAAQQLRDAAKAFLCWHCHLGRQCVQLQKVHES
eukprot:GHUV01011421.1.p3 GENE.GHUV01011421.1~~GHUV01011421.1.p3  ORF type:complete len:109 (-),score=23.71 GHUV01011421.1:363-689(-)